MPEIKKSKNDVGKVTTDVAAPPQGAQAFPQDIVPPQQSSSGSFGNIVNTIIRMAFIYYAILYFKGRSSPAFR